jgi:phosphoserine phosphatase RsbU/P
MADATTTDRFLRDQLLERRRRLEGAIAISQSAANLAQLLSEVDSALERMDEGVFGICETCHDTIEKDRLIADPLVRYCLDHLTREQRSALEQDLELAARMQREMLPSPHTKFAGWEAYYHYKGLGAVSGDYCDLIQHECDGGNLYFILGDASGKGVAASMLMSHLHAIFRTLIETAEPLDRLMMRASRIFCESALSPYFATLVCGKASASGEIEIGNAGHCPPLLLQDGKATKFEATGAPLGMFCEGSYSSQRFKLAPGDTLFLYSDGLTEARNHADEDYGEARLADLIAQGHNLEPKTLVDSCLQDLEGFLAGVPLHDDLTLMALRRDS